MRDNHVKQKLLSGETSFGTFMFEFNTTGVARIAAVAGAEFAVFDMEHTGWSVETIRGLIASTPKADLMPVVRIPAVEYHFVARVLDMGAMGIMAPMVESAAQAERLVSAAKYPPMGRRGAAFGIAHDDYNMGKISETMSAANRNGLMIAQIETVTGLANVEEIAAVPGIDVLWMGLFDLTSSMGIPGEMENRRVLDAIDRTMSACKKFGKVPAVMVTSVAEGHAQLTRGFRMIGYSGDHWIYQAALKECLNSLKSFKR